MLRALGWSRGPGHQHQERSCCCDGGLSSFGPLKGPAFLYLCDLKWPCTVRWDVALDSALLSWEHGPRARVGFSPHAGIPRCPREEVSNKTWGPPSRTMSSHPYRYSVLPLLAGSCSFLQRWAKLWMVCLSLMVTGSVLWTSPQDVDLSLLETELGLRAA